MLHTSLVKPGKPLVRKERLQVHLALALGTVAGCLLALIYDRSALIAEPLSVGLGYVALVYLVLGLLIGPLYLARRRRNPVNIYLRRDVGIWAGITALVHVLLSFQIFANGQALLYFFQQVRDHYLPKLDLFGLSNYLGLLAAVIIFVLLALSNDLALRWLKGKRWKRIQQWTYPLVALTVLHTLGYQLYNERDTGYVWALLALSVLVVVAQGTGFLVHRRRARQRAVPQERRSRTAGNAAPLPAPPPRFLSPESNSPFAPDSLSRRRFLQLGGTALLGGIATAVALRATGQALRPIVRTSVLVEPPATSPATSELPPTRLPTPAVAADNEPAQTTIAPADSPPVDTPVATNPTTTDTTAPASPTTAAAPEPSPTSPAAEASSGVVLTTLAACPVNSAVTFTAPDTGETGILVHEADGSVKAFSNICTHRPYPVEYDPNAQLLVCPLHYACFSATSGKVTQGPAHRPLPPMQVHVDGHGNILYG